METEELIGQDLVKSKMKTQDDLADFKRKISKKYKIEFPANTYLLKTYRNLAAHRIVKKNPAIERLLRTRPVRSLSGIINVSVLTKPYPCPGQCIYCPLEQGIPKSYLSGEPAVERAKRLKFDPFLQTKERINALAKEGHPTDKIDLRIIGATWSYYPKQYQTWFVKRCFDAANNKTSKNLPIAHKLNERSRHRIIGLSTETRPDFIDKKEVARMRKLGITKVEIGVQSVYDDVLKLIRREHTTDQSRKSTKLLREAGIKVSYHVMPDLPGTTPKKDIDMLKIIFSDPGLKPDLMKIYPCALLEEAPLYHTLYKQGLYKPFSEKTLLRIIKESKKFAPYYVRIERITRDIPAPRIITGPAKITNFREVVAREIEKERWKCKCIRCREIKQNYSQREKAFLFRQDYGAGGGKEIFLSFENKNRTKLYSLLRLRIPSYTLSNTKHFISVLNNSAIIREIHTYGQMVPISKKKTAPQHKGFGTRLIKEAEKIAFKEFGLKKIAAISGVGVRDYWRKFEYELKDTYMVKNI
jgi:elongator complex protein 3